ncbi:MAG: glycosyltransferase [Clostridia bacterium]|nr:glycosyltransferase [Clostridia bacterium]
MKTQVIIFSKNRALQLQAALESFLRQCADATNANIRVLYKASDARHERQYRVLRTRFPGIQFVTETNFRPQLLRLAADGCWLLLLVDDVIFHRPFTLAECITALESQPEALSVSLLLGTNTVYCHTQDVPQPAPDMEMATGRFLRFRWQNAAYDFGYPLEVSGSLYRASHILALLHDIPFENPNRLEAILSTRIGHVEQFPWRLVFSQSVGFCNPLNRVQQVFANRIAAQSVDAEILADEFDQGQAIDLDAFADLTPNAAHFEVAVRFRSIGSKLERVSVPPRISVVIPVHNGSAFLPEAVSSLAAQEWESLEVVIVNDGSQDDSSTVAHELAARHPELRIQVVDKENGGLADARNAGISVSSGDWILPLDCDDRFAPGFLRQALHVIEHQPEINLVFADMQEFGASNKTWRPANYSWQELLVHNTFPCASLYRRELWEMSGGYDPSLPWGAEDWNFWLACAAFGLRPHRIPEFLFEYRVHSGGSMYTRMMAHWDEVQACLRTMHPALYPVEVLIADHQTIANMHPHTLARVEAVAARHPHLPMPYFWRGLVHEAGGRTAEALADYTRATILASHAQWQPQFRAYFINTALGRTGAAQQAALSVLTRRPELARAFRQNLKMDLKRQLPLNLAITSNVSQWQAMQDNDYFERHNVYLDESKRLKDFGDDLAWIERRRPLDPSMRVAVIGCGYGRETAMIAPRVAHVWGIDVSPRILEKCRRRLRSKGINNVTMVQADSWKTVIPNRLDFVYCITVFQHLTRDLVEDYLCGLGRKLTPGGQFLCQFAELKDGTHDARLEVYEPSVLWTVPEIEAVIRNAGLTLFDIETQRVGGGLWHWAHFGQPGAGPAA